MTAPTLETVILRASDNDARKTSTLASWHANANRLSLATRHSPLRPRQSRVTSL
jgi:hypothetical protein